MESEEDTDAASMVTTVSYSGTIIAWKATTRTSPEVLGQSSRDNNDQSTAKADSLSLCLYRSGFARLTVDYQAWRKLN